MHFDEGRGQKYHQLRFLATHQEGTDGGVEMELYATQRWLLSWWLDGQNCCRLRGSTRSPMRKGRELLWQRRRRGLVLLLLLLVSLLVRALLPLLRSHGLGAGASHL